MKNKLLKVIIKYPLIEILFSIFWLYPYKPMLIYDQWLADAITFCTINIVKFTTDPSIWDNYGRGAGITIGFISFLAFCLIKIIILILAIYYFRKYKSSLDNKKAPL